MKDMKWIYLIVILIAVLSCNQGDQNNNKSIEEEAKAIKLIAQQRPFGETAEIEMQVENALDKLEFVNPADVEIDSMDLVLGIPLGEIQVAIPLTYMAAYEVANISIDTNNYLITWCSIVGSARIFEGGMESDDPGFDFGKALNKNNLLVVDRKTRSVWNQLSGKAIHGALEGDNLSPLPAIQSTWGFWKRKYPTTRLLINRDTTDAIFPQFVNEVPHYYSWRPGDGRPEFSDVHQIETLGMGIEMGSSSVFFPFEMLFEKRSPLKYKIENQLLMIHFDKSGLTAWVEDVEGNMIPSVITYSWAWKAFYPDTETFETKPIETY